MTERAKIRRGAQARRPRASVIQRRPSMPARGKASASRALAVIPLPVEKLRRWSWRALWALIALAAGVLLLALHVPRMIGTALAEAGGEMGLSIRHVQLTGTHHLDQLTVDSVAFDGQTMPLLDLEMVRAKLLRYPWVADARVSRRLPDTLLIDIVERQPAAIWQYRGRLELIDKAGVVLAPVDLEHMKDLPIVVGPDANQHVPELALLLDAAPALKPMFAGASWIGDRRWDVRFQTGETLALPEGADAARAAFAKFQKMDQATPLLGRNYSHFDMRIDGRFAARFRSPPPTLDGTPAKPVSASAPAHGNPPADVI